MNEQAVKVESISPGGQTGLATTVDTNVKAEFMNAAGIPLEVGQIVIAMIKSIPVGNPPKEKIIAIILRKG